MFFKKKCYLIIPNNISHMQNVLKQLKYKIRNMKNNNLSKLKNLIIKQGNYQLTAPNI